MTNKPNEDAENVTCVDIDEEGEEDEDDEEEEYEDEMDELEADLSDYEQMDGKVCVNEAIDYEDDRIIIKTNVKNQSEDQGYDEYFKFWPMGRQDEDNLVMKICNHVREDEKKEPTKDAKRLFI